MEYTLKLAGAHTALYDGYVPLKIQQSLSVLINLESRRANERILIICCHLVLILPAPYSHMMLAWARVGDGQLDSDLDKMSSYLLRLCNFVDLTFIGLL